MNMCANSVVSKDARVESQLDHGVKTHTGVTCGAQAETSRMGTYRGSDGLARLNVNYSPQPLARLPGQKHPERRANASV